MTNPGSVTSLFEQIRAGSPQDREEAARRLWLRHVPQLREPAFRRLDKRLRLREDEEDVVQNVYGSFFVRLERGDFRLENRHDLWRLLVTLTLNKTRKAAVRHGNGIRDYRRDQQLAGPDDSFGPEDALAQLAERDLSPDEIAELNDDLHYRLAMLPEPLRQIAVWKLEGYTNKEIAAPERLNCCERTVERKLEVIRCKWQKPL